MTGEWTHNCYADEEACIKYDTPFCPMCGERAPWNTTPDPAVKFVEAKRKALRAAFETLTEYVEEEVSASGTGGDSECAICYKVEPHRPWCALGKALAALELDDDTGLPELGREAAG